jgi:hypothetical protein
MPFLGFATLPRSSLLFSADRRSLSPLCYSRRGQGLSRPGPGGELRTYL